MFSSVSQGRRGPGSRNGSRCVALLAHFREYPHGRQDPHKTNFMVGFSKCMCFGVIKSCEERKQTDQRKLCTCETFNLLCTGAIFFLPFHQNKEIEGNRNANNTVLMRLVLAKVSKLPLIGVHLICCAG